MKNEHQCRVCLRTDESRGNTTWTQKDLCSDCARQTLERFGPEVEVEFRAPSSRPNTTTYFNVKRTSDGERLGSIEFNAFELKTHVLAFKEDGSSAHQIDLNLEDVDVRRGDGAALLAVWETAIEQWTRPTDRRTFYVEGLTVSVECEVDVLIYVEASSADEAVRMVELWTRDRIIQQLKDDDPSRIDTVLGSSFAERVLGERLHRTAFFHRANMKATDLTRRP